MVPKPSLITQRSAFRGTSRNPEVVPAQQTQASTVAPEGGQFEATFSEVMWLGEPEIGWTPDAEEVSVRHSVEVAARAADDGWAYPERFAARGVSLDIVGLFIVVPRNADVDDRHC